MSDDTQRKRRMLLVLGIPEEHVDEVLSDPACWGTIDTLDSAISDITRKTLALMRAEGLL
jgi:hypothetical protein